MRNGHSTMSRASEGTIMTDDPTNSIDLEHADRVRVGVTRGETARSIGRPRDYPDRSDVSVEPAREGRVLLSLNTMAGDHGTGHADIEFTLEEARQLRELLDETVREIGEE
ncbi:hypothetical protein [Halomontanus rarus]|uniref:hypothetical protein n=1 Tax=Halomontanus rarus TaxID=3034020 RepID=UPI003CE491B1